MPKFDLEFASPLMNAAGSLGFMPDFLDPQSADMFGAFITNPVSRMRRVPAKGTRLLQFPGGILLHTGHPNPGLRSVLKRYSASWQRSPVPVLVHLLYEGIESVNKSLRILEEASGVSGVELGLPSDLNYAEIEKIIHSLVSELPVIIRLPISILESLTAILLPPLIDKFVAVSFGPARGILCDPGGQFVSGRMYGPALFPRTLAMTKRLSEMGVPVIAGGGVYHQAQVQDLLRAGAIAVQLDTVLWRGGLANN